MIDSTPLLRLYARWRRAALASADPVEGQERLLLALLSRGRETRFGRDHGFSELRSVADFQARVPLRRYDDFWRDYWQKPFPVMDDVTWPGRIPNFAVTSGTTSGASKFIPISDAMTRANARAGIDLLVHHVTHRPRSRVFGGKAFMLGGSTDLVVQAPGIHSGDLSGIASKNLPIWARHLAFPPLDIALMADWEAKVERIGRIAHLQDIRTISGTPSWLLLLFDRQHALTGLPAKATALYPRLDLLVHGGVNFGPYRKRFEAFLEGSQAELREVYPASEGFIALADEGPADGLRLLADNGLFFEFVPVDELDRPKPTRYWLKTVETDVNYAIVLTTCAGLWSYVLGDTVRFVSLDPPRLIVTGRTSYMMSAFGEHLIDEEIEDAVTQAADGVGASVVDYAMGAIFPEQVGEIGGHLFVVEFDRIVATESVAAFATAIDTRLSTRNDDYRSHRSGGFGMKAPIVKAVAAGTFARWMKQRGRLGGQNKVPRVINDTVLFADLCRCAGIARD